MPPRLSQQLLRVLGVVIVTAILAFVLLPALVVTLAAFNGRARRPSPTRIFKQASATA
jgi:uncharacterized membrane protein